MKITEVISNNEQNMIENSPNKSNKGTEIVRFNVRVNKNEKGKFLLDMTEKTAHSPLLPLTYNNFSEKLTQLFPSYKHQIEEGRMKMNCKVGKGKNTIQTINNEEELQRAIAQIQLWRMEKREKRKKVARKEPRSVTLQLRLFTEEYQEKNEEDEKNEGAGEGCRTRRKQKFQRKRNNALADQIGDENMISDIIFDHSDRKRRKNGKCQGDQCNKLLKKQRISRIIEDDIEFDHLNEWPSEITKLYLDGNNMFFLTSTLRSLSLKRKGSSERILCAISQSLHSSTPLQYTNLCFDRSKVKFDHLGDQDGFEVSSAAAMQFPSADDALVSMAQREENKSSCLFITSDRELRARLKEVGVNVAKPKRWMQFACTLVHPSGDVSLDNWIDQLSQSL